MCAVKEDTENKDKDEHVCGCKCEIYSRCCGYYRPVQNWNIGKQEEFKERVLFTVYDPKEKQNGDN